MSSETSATVADSRDRRLRHTRRATAVRASDDRCEARMFSWGVEAFTCSQVFLVAKGRRGVSRTRSMSNTLALLKVESQGNSVWDLVAYSYDVLWNGGSSSL